MNSKISIVIPVYNVEKYLKRCLDSIVNQKSDFIEIVLVDDGSSDKSSIICEEYSKKYSYIKAFSKSNGGASSARNYGIKKATGQYIWFIDSDDKIKNGCLNDIKNILERIKPDVVISQSKKVLENGDMIDECIYTIPEGEYNSCQFMKVLKRNPKSVIFAPQYYIVKRDFIIKNNIYFYEGIIHEDELWIPQLLIKSNKIYYSNLNIYYHYMWEGSVMHSTKREKSGRSCLIVSNNLCKFFNNSKRNDLEFLRDKNANTFLQAVWKIPNFLNNKENIKRTMPLKNSYYFNTRLKSFIYFISPKLYLFIHNTIQKRRENK
ncbi:MAG: glycosyltransferase [Firmicutes bacterium]|nr:glycosyltransferase [Bacillota bacterium]